MSRPLASLSSGLLARKGAARPAMRPQGFAAPARLDDLGWNDMGGEPVPAPAAQVPLAEAPAAQAPAAPSLSVQRSIAPAPDEPSEAAPIPVVLVERDALMAAIEAPEAVRPVSVHTAARLRRETQHAGKAALTLRLDGDRHLKLRLAGAIANRSAQQLLTQALDALIDSMPTVDALVAQLPPAKPSKR